MKSNFSLRTAVIIPYIVIMTIMSIAIALIMQSNYQFLAEQQGSRIIGALSANTNEKLNAFMGEPYNHNMLFSAILSRTYTQSPEAIAFNKDYILDIMKTQRVEHPQISVVAYGDESMRFLGYRANSDASYSLMIKDESTEQELRIYAGEGIDSEVLAAYEDYNPTTRPWYAPVKSNPIPQWSEVYVNVDEMSETTISAIAPITHKGKFIGVTSIDVKLEGIEKFLKTQEAKGTGIIYVVDRNWGVIAQSGDLVHTPLTPAEKSDEAMIYASAQWLRRATESFNEVNRVEILNDSYYVLANEVDDSLNLGWKVIVVIPESDIMGTVELNIQRSMAVLFLIIIVTTLFGIAIMNRITKPILAVAYAANDLSQGKWGISLPLHHRPLKENYELVTAFNKMSLQIKENLDQIEHLHLEEKQILERAIAERTAELELTMQELMSREKLASLGSLVSGISHEINTPLGVSVTASSYMEETNKNIRRLLQDNAMTKQDFLKYIETMDESVHILNTNLNRASELIKSFKDIAVSQTSEELMDFNMSEYIHQVIVSLKHEYKHTNYTFEVDCDPSLEIKSYPGAWSQILTNFIMNSLKHGFSNRDQGTMHIQVKNKENTLEVIYSDNGNGIDAQHVPRVFDPFYTTSRGSGGSGLGLNIVYNLVTGLLGGSIELDNATEAGVRFVIIVPYHMTM